LLLKQKDNYYGDNTLQIIEEEKLNSVIKTKLEFDNIYYSLDGHNFFKRKDRYKNKYALIVSFFLFSIYNAFEFIENIIQFAQKKNSNKYSSASRITTLLFNMFNIFNILFLTTITIIKLRVHTVVYY